MYYPTYPYQQSYKITRVNGENGARTLQMPPNSETLLLDETAPLVWLAVTDGAGYKTVTPYSITPYTPKVVNVEDLEARLERLEHYYEQSNITEPATTAEPVGTDGTETAVSAVRKGKSRANA